MSQKNTRKKQYGMDMTNGSLGDKIIRFVLPLALTSILQQMFNAADIAVVGRFAGTQAMAAVGSNAPVIGLMVNLFTGVSIGANVVISHYTGQGNAQGVNRAAHTAVITALICGLLVCGIGQLTAKPLLGLLGVPDDVFAMALTYLRIYLLGMPVILLYNFESAMFRSQGDTRTPLICLVISGVLNVCLNLFFVLVAGMSAAGVAIATVLANLVSSGLLFFILLRTDKNIHIDPSRLRIYVPDLKEMLRIGLPAGLQGMVFSVSNTTIQSAINSLGSLVMAASAAAFNMEIIAYFLVNAFGQACTTFTGQNFGAGKPDRCRKTLVLCLVQNTISIILLCGLMLLLRNQLLGIFNPDPAILAFGSIRLFCLLPFEPLNGAIEIISGSLRGYGRSLGPALMALIGICVTRITWVLLVFPAHRSFLTLMIAYPVSWVITVAALVIYYLRHIKRIEEMEPVR